MAPFGKRFSISDLCQITTEKVVKYKSLTIRVKVIFKNQREFRKVFFQFFTFMLFQDLSNVQTNNTLCSPTSSSASSDNTETVSYYHIYHLFLQGDLFGPTLMIHPNFLCSDNFISHLWRIPPLILTKRTRSYWRILNWKMKTNREEIIELWSRFPFFCDSIFRFRWISITISTPDHSSTMCLKWI